jgi:5-methylcytosine-specific restriction endonuclease McrA
MYTYNSTARRIEKQCEECANPFSVPPAQAKVRRFCKPACSNLWNSNRFKTDARLNKGSSRQVRCAWCDKGYSVPQSKQRKSYYCSRVCLATYRTSRRADLPCETCGKVKSVMPKEISTFRFCSKACKWEDMKRSMVGENNPAWIDREHVACESCGKVYRSHGSRKNRFCNMRCFGKYMSTANRGENNPLWKGGISSLMSSHEWRKNNLAKRREVAAKRRARELGCQRVETIDRTLIIQRDQSACYICDKILTLEKITIDHVVPIAKGGEASYSNLKVCCRSCNARKGNKLLSEFICFLGER